MTETELKNAGAIELGVEIIEGLYETTEPDGFRQ